MPKDVKEGMAYGFFQYLTKPVNIDEFFAALDDALKLSRDRRAENSIRHQEESWHFPPIFAQLSF